jgi:hypothetical protein
MWQGDFIYPRPVSPSSSQNSRPAEDQVSETSSEESDGTDGEADVPDHDYIPSPSKRSRSDGAPRGDDTPVVVREREAPSMSERVEQDPTGKDQ